MNQGEKFVIKTATATAAQHRGQLKWISSVCSTHTHIHNLPAYTILCCNAFRRCEKEMVVLKGKKITPLRHTIEMKLSRATKMYTAHNVELLLSAKRTVTENLLLHGLCSI